MDGYGAGCVTDRFEREMQRRAEARTARPAGAWVRALVNGKRRKGRKS
ncbi:hypothetical protein ACWGDS_01375 [Streptomyces sp. NPDC055059]|jgi:hypothetical protein|uniref:Uncharacterized protein n=1 Tax=Streptomyces sp. NBC_00119 TaxID=2975659 RepID=A0AAU1U2T2_9ACTN|nr:MULTISPECIES: hypothetical protein [unclassified Streptomyces]MCX4642241.1 hypothetical protein [Streptomyces sp. NBC_01446]MCX5327185.1 hypothetical protein [Streptomyces sp. NBC_00120]